jgi:hypothetical protein
MSDILKESSNPDIIATLYRVSQKIWHPPRNFWNVRPWWFNPPYNSNVKTKIGHKFLLAIDDCFPKNNPLHKIFNRNTLKLSYSCMPNIRNIISGHNNYVVNKLTSTDASTCSTKPRQCNCRNKSSCPLPGKCLTSSVVYQASVVRNDTNQKESYVGHTEGEFKSRYYWLAHSN